MSLHRNHRIDGLHRTHLLPLPRRFYLGYGAREDEDCLFNHFS